MQIFANKKRMANQSTRPISHPVKLKAMCRQHKADLFQHTFNQFGIFNAFHLSLGVTYNDDNHIGRIKILFRKLLDLIKSHIVDDLLFVSNAIDRKIIFVDTVKQAYKTVLCLKLECSL